VLGLPADIARGQRPIPGQKEPIGGSGYYRIKAPFQVLEEQGLAEVDYGVWPLDQIMGFLRDRVCDVLVCQRQTMEWQKALVSEAQKYGVAAVYDTDDVALNLSPGNPMYVWFGDNRKAVLKCFRKLQAQNQVDPMITKLWTEDKVWQFAQANRQTYKWMLTNADLVTVTSQYIVDLYESFAGPMQVLPNMIEDRDWADVEPRRVPGCGERKVIGWAGGDSHEPDLRMIARPLAKLFAQRDDVVLVLVGWAGGREVFPRQMQPRIFTVDWSGIDEYRGWLGGFDIGLAPAVDMPTNRAKSAIRVYELALANSTGVPVIASPSPYGMDVHKDMGQVVSKPIKWTRAIVRYLDEPEVARQHAVSLREHVLSEHTYTANAWRWLEAYEMAVELRERSKCR